MHHRSARPHQAADSSAPGQPARPRTLGTIRLRGGRGGSLGPRGHAAGVMPARCGSARHAGGLRRPSGSARAGGRQASGPKTVGVRGPASSRRPDRTATAEPVITIIFQNRCWVFGPGIEFTGKGGEEPLSGEEGRAPPLERPAVRRPSAGPTWRDCGGIEDQVSPESWGRTMDGSRARRTRDRARRAWYAGWRQYRFARHYGFVSGTTTSGAARICCPMKNQPTPISS
jgi:hypothetical protein